MINYAQQIKERISLQDVLQRYGFKTVKNKMCCPFHNEKTPSFTVFSTDTYYCFGCGASGDVIKFVQNYYNCDYKSAVEHISNDFGLFLFSKPTLTQKRKMDKHIVELEKSRMEQLKRDRQRSIDYWNAFDNVLELEHLIEHNKPLSVEDEPNEAFIFALQNIEFARFKLECAEAARGGIND